MDLVWGMGIGLFIGATLGITLTAMLNAASKADMYAEMYRVIREQNDEFNFCPNCGYDNGSVNLRDLKEMD